MYCTRSLSLALKIHIMISLYLLIFSKEIFLLCKKRAMSFFLGSLVKWDLRISSYFLSLTEECLHQISSIKSPKCPLCYECITWKLPSGHQSLATKDSLAAMPMGCLVSGYLSVQPFPYLLFISIMFLL